MILFSFNPRRQNCVGRARELAAFSTSVAEKMGEDLTPCWRGPTALIGGGGDVTDVNWGGVEGFEIWGERSVGREKQVSVNIVNKSSLDSDSSKKYLLSHNKSLKKSQKLEKNLIKNNTYHIITMIFYIINNSLKLSYNES